MLANKDFNYLAKRKPHSFKKILLACTILSVSIPVFAQQVTTDSAGVFCNTVGTPLPQGSIGSEVVALQSLLRQKYAYKVVATGFFGPVTDYYVRVLQKSLGVRNPSGALGPITMALLKDKWCAPMMSTNQATISNLAPITNATTVVTNQAQTILNPSSTTSVATTTTLVTNQTTTSNSSFTATTTSTFNQTPVTTTNSNGSVNTTAPVANTVTQPTLDVSVDPQAVPEGGTTTLKWKAANVTKCTISTIGQTKQVVIEGSMTAGVFPSVRSASVNESSYNPNSYSLTCDGIYGSITKEVLLK